MRISDGVQTCALPIYRRPVFLLAQAVERERRQLARVGPRPLAGRDLRGGVRGVEQRVVLAVELAFLHRADLVADLDHRVDEAVELVRSAERRVGKEGGST